MLFEPIKDIADVHGERLHKNLCNIRDQMARVAEAVEAQLARNQWVSKSLGVPKAETLQLRNESAYGWLIRDVAVTLEAEIFLNVSAGQGFLCKLKAGERENVHWYVPPGSIVLVKNLGEAEAFANFQIEVLVTPASPAHTGRSQEYMDSPRIHEIPSGHALDEYPVEAALAE